MPTKFFCARCNEFVRYVDCPDPKGIGAHKLICGPNVCADAIVEFRGRIVLIFRGKANEAGAGTWALPGGYMHYRERCADAAVRETKEESGLDLVSVQFFGVYDDPRRDMFDDRNNVSLVYTGIGIGELAREDADGEVSAVRAFTQEEIEDLTFGPLDTQAERSFLAVSHALDASQFACGQKFVIGFDHGRILRDYFARRER